MYLHTLWKFPWYRQVALEFLYDRTMCIDIVLVLYINKKIRESIVVKKSHMASHIMNLSSDLSICFVSKISQERDNNF